MKKCYIFLPHIHPIAPKYLKYREKNFSFIALYNNRYIVIEESLKFKTFLLKEKYFNLLEVNNLLNAFGFTIDLSLGSLTGIPLSKTTKDIAIIARKFSNIS